jgi:chromosome segregation ATPase
MVVLQKTQKELQDGSRRINEMMEEMEKKEREVDQSITVMKDKNAQLESLLEYLRAQPDDVNVDEAVSATTPLYEQSVHHTFVYCITCIPAVDQQCPY